MRTTKQRRLRRIIIGIILFPILLILLVMGLLYVPSIQDRMVRFASEKLSEQLGMQVTIGEVRLKFPLSLSVSNLDILRTERDTLAHLGRLEIELSLRPLLSKEVVLPGALARDLSLYLTDSLGLSTTRLDLVEAKLQETTVSLEEQLVNLSLLETTGGYIHYYSIDTIAKPEEEDTLRWRIFADQIHLRNTSIEVDMPIDSLQISTYVRLLSLQKGQADLGTKRFDVGHALLDVPALCYGVDREPSKAIGLDLTRWDVRSLELEARDISSQQQDLHIAIVRGKARERSGLELAELSGVYAQDSMAMSLSDLILRTPHSSIEADVTMPWSFLTGASSAELYSNISASLGSQDLSLITSSFIDTRDVNRWAGELGERPINLDMQVVGSLENLDIRQGKVTWPEVIDLSMQGGLKALHRPDATSGEVKLEARTLEQSNRLLALLGQNDAYHLPAGMKLTGFVKARRGDYALDLKLKDADSQVHLGGRYQARVDIYEGTITAENLDMRRYMPRDSIGRIDLSLQLSGRGVDMLNPKSQGLVKGRIHRLDYGAVSLNGITLDGELKAGNLTASLNSSNPGLSLSVLVDGQMNHTNLYTSIAVDSEDIDPALFGLANLPQDMAFRLEGEMRSDMKDRHQLSANLKNVRLRIGGQTIAPERVSLRAETTDRSISADVISGDLILKARIAQGIKGLAATSERLAQVSAKVLSDIQHNYFTPITLKETLSLLPPSDLSLSMGRENALTPYLARQRISLQSLRADITTGGAGLASGDIHLEELRLDTLRIRSATLSMKTIEHPWLIALDTLLTKESVVDRQEQSQIYIDPEALHLTLQVDRPYHRGNPGMNILADAKLNLQRTEMKVELRDLTNKPIHQIALGGSWVGRRYLFSILDPDVYIGYNKLLAPYDNFISLDKQSYKISSNLHLIGEGNASLSLVSDDDENPEVQYLSLLIRQLKLQEFQALGLPNIEGTLGADIQYSREGGWKAQPIITGDLSVNGLRYEGKALGDFGSALFYEPRTDHSHYITAEVSHDGNPALALNAIYYPSERLNQIKGGLKLQDFPLEMANPFLAGVKMGLLGQLSGELELQGHMAAPRVSGFIATRSAQVHLNEYATKLALSDSAVRLEGGRLEFDRYAIRSTVDSLHPIMINGHVTMAGEQMGMTDLRIRADEVTLFDQSSMVTADEIVYGRLLASADMRLRGPMDALRVRGDLSILGGTNLTYVMKEGVLNEENKLGELVRFVDFSDTLHLADPAPEARNLGGLDIRLGINVDPAVRFGVDLGSSGKDYVRVQGGGELQFSYPPYGEMRLVGRYNMSQSGELRYTMPLIGAKTFVIDPAGYLRWSGSVSNPYINFSATQKVRATVTDPNGATQYANFLVGINAKDHVEKINLSFDLSAPENLSLQNRLTAMSKEERGKQAIGLLATGVYLADGGGAKLNFDNALSSLLQSQINKAAGDLLQGTDLNLGMEHSDGSDGGRRYTNYTYSFSRRFYNDRLKIVVGGKVQSGENATNTEQQLIDNIAVEYQIDKSGHQHIRIYHKRVTDDILEGEYSETGVGYVLRRKLRRLSDLIPWRKSKKSRRLQFDTPVISPRPDSLSR